MPQPAQQVDLGETLFVERCSRALLE